MSYKIKLSFSAQALFLQANFSAEFVKQMVLHLIIAGRDTTACLLSWMFYELTKNEEVQLRLHQEIMEKLPPGSPMDWKSLSNNEMPYLHGVVYEALRLWPPVPFDIKMAFEDDVLPGGWKVPKFANVAFIPYNMGRDPKRYPEPLQFRPERWIPFKPPPQHEFPVFQAGPRICLGMDMAIFEAKTCAVELLRHCRFEMVPGQEITYGDKITMDIKSNGKDEFLVSVKPWWWNIWKPTLLLEFVPFEGCGRNFASCSTGLVLRSFKAFCQPLHSAAGSKSDPKSSSSFCKGPGDWSMKWSFSVHGFRST